MNIHLAVLIVDHKTEVEIALFKSSTIKSRANYEKMAGNLEFSLQ